MTMSVKMEMDPILFKVGI